IIFALGAPHRGQMRPDPARFAMAGSPYVPLDSPKPMKVTRFERLFLVFSLLSIGFASPRAQPGPAPSRLAHRRRGFENRGDRPDSRSRGLRPQPRDRHAGLDRYTHSPELA